MLSDEVLQAINKHTMGDRSEFNALKERFTSAHYMSCPAAAALGYLIAKGELEAEKEEEEEEEPDVYDKAVEVIKKYCHPPGNNSAHTATDEIFTLIYEWLDDDLKKNNYAPLGLTRTIVRELFEPFIIKKSE
jgi:hypothetical protein